MAATVDVRMLMAFGLSVEFLELKIPEKKKYNNITRGHRVPTSVFQQRYLVLLSEDRDLLSKLEVCEERLKPLPPPPPPPLPAATPRFR